jgi:hypothetical protein
MVSSHGTAAKYLCQPQVILSMMIMTCSIGNASAEPQALMRLPGRIYSGVTHKNIEFFYLPGLENNIDNDARRRQFPVILLQQFYQIQYHNMLD